MRNTPRRRNMSKCEPSGPACPGRRAVRGAAAEQSLGAGLNGRRSGGPTPRVCGASETSTTVLRRRGLKRRGAEVVLSAPPATRLERLSFYHLT